MQTRAGSLTSVAPRGERAGAAVLAAAALAGSALVALVDPGVPGRYPTCPSAALLGFDCPACGTLRGLHALAHGDVLGALDHNLLLLAAVPVGALLWFRWLRTAAGRHSASRRAALVPRWPGWAGVLAVAVALLFTVSRNLPFDAVGWLDASSG